MGYLSCSCLPYSRGNSFKIVIFLTSASISHQPNSFEQNLGFLLKVVWKLVYGVSHYILLFFSFSFFSLFFSRLG